MSKRDDRDDDRRSSRSAAAEMFEDLARGADLVRWIKFPGTDRDVALKPLVQSQMQDAMAAARARFKKLGIVEVTGTTAYDWGAEVNLQCVARSLRDPSPDNAPRYDRPFFASADEARDLLMPDQLAALVEDFEAIMVRADPVEADLTEAQLRDIEGYVKKKDVASLVATGCLTLASYLLTTASRLETSPSGRLPTSP